MVFSPIAPLFLSTCFGWVISNFGILHSPGGSCAKTDEKNSDKASIFLISLVIKDPSSCTKNG